jgi:transcriptional regulator with XRE-family HTH domain
MLKLGATAKYLREAQGLTQRAAADALGISDVHLCNIERDKAMPSPELLDTIRRTWGIDLYVLAWCMKGDLRALPVPVREATARLTDAWKAQIERRFNGKKSECSTSAR